MPYKLCVYHAVFAIDLAIEISRLKYTSISGLYKMSVGGAKCRVYLEGARFRVAGTALGFRRNVLKCLIALGHKGRLVLCGLPNVGLMSRPILFVVLLPLGACLPSVGLI